MQGPSRTVTISPPSAKDEEESRRLVEFVDMFAAHKDDRLATVLELLHVAARTFLNVCSIPSPPPSSPASISGLYPVPQPGTRSPPDVAQPWVQLRLFGSAGLESNVRFSDVDAYAG
jgi:hypothetical protein